MMEVAVMIAKMMPEEDLVKMLKEECEIFLAISETQKDEVFKKVAANSMMVTLKLQYKDKELSEAMEEIDEMKKIHDVGSGIIHPGDQ